MVRAAEIEIVLAALDPVLSPLGHRRAENR
jgi:hypothetical protein